MEIILLSVVMWDAFKTVMSCMVVSRVSKNAIEEIRGMSRLNREYDLEFPTRVIFSSPTVERPSEEKDCIGVFLKVACGCSR